MIAKFSVFLGEKGGNGISEQKRWKWLGEQTKVILMLAVGLSYSEIGKRPLER